MTDPPPTFSDLARDGVEAYARRFGGTGPWIFQHVPKTAGSSLTQELRRALPPYRNIFIGPEGWRSPLPNRELMDAEVEAFLAEAAATRFGAASGHLHHAQVDRILAALPGARAFTVLRDPVERYVSDYRYTRTEKHPTHEEVRRRYPDFESYLADPRTHDKMWRLLAPAGAGVGEVLGRLAFVGRVEDVEDGFAFLTALTGRPHRMTTRANATVPGPENDVHLDDALRARVAAANRRDAALYAAASEVLEARGAEMRAFVAERAAAG